MLVGNRNHLNSIVQVAHRGLLSELRVCAAMSPSAQDRPGNLSAEASDKGAESRTAHDAGPAFAIR